MYTKRKTADQVTLHAQAPIAVVESLDEALAIFGIVT
jgi:hypothetical protein